jgi:DNA polymerase III psi subunit
MIEERRKAYLEAMGYDVWVARPPPPEPGSLVISSGKGSVLLICDQPAACATKLSGDIARAFGQDPVWAWPAGDDDQVSEQLEDAVGDRLLTDVVVFGEDLARGLFRGAPPALLASAKLTVTSGMEELEVRGAAKRQLWALIREFRQTAVAVSS